MSPAADPFPHAGAGPPAGAGPLLELRGVAKTYARGGASVEALRGVDVCVDRG